MSDDWTPETNPTLDRVAAINAYDMSFLYDRWVEKSHGLVRSGDCETAARELKRFFSLSLIYPDQLLFPPPRIDACWHEFILFTGRYRRFCREVVGQEYLHHNPRPPLDPTQDGPTHTLDLYTQAFGPPSAYWWGPVGKAEQRWLLYQHSFPDLLTKKPSPSRLIAIGLVTLALLAFRRGSQDER